MAFFHPDMRLTGRWISCCFVVLKSTTALTMKPYLILIVLAALAAMGCFEELRGWWADLHPARVGSYPVNNHLPEGEFRIIRLDVQPGAEVTTIAGLYQVTGYGSSDCQSYQLTASSGLASGCYRVTTAGNSSPALCRANWDGRPCAGSTVARYRLNKINRS